MDYSTAFDNHNGKDNPRPLDDGLDAFDCAKAAPRFRAVPPGTYEARVKSGEYRKTRKGDPSYWTRFEIVEGPHKGATILKVWMLTPEFVGDSKFNLEPLGLKTKIDLLSPFPPAAVEIRARITVALRRGDDGQESNDLKHIDTIRVSKSPAAEFLLPDDDDTEGGAK